MSARRKPGPIMPRLGSRVRAEEAVLLRARGRTYQEIADELGFANRGTARKAILREMKRADPETPDEARHALLDSARYTSRRWHDAFDNAVEARDLEGMSTAHRGLVKDRDLVARLCGAYAPEKQQLDVTISTVEDTRKRLLAAVEQQRELPVIDAEVVA